MDSRDGRGNWRNRSGRGRPPFHVYNRQGGSRNYTNEGLSAGSRIDCDEGPSGGPRNYSNEGPSGCYSDGNWSSYDDGRKRTRDYRAFSPRRYDNSTRVSEDAGLAMNYRREKPPPHLRGKDIGMWYRDRNREKQKRQGLTKQERAKRNMMKKTCIPIELPVEKIQMIREFLDGIGCEAPRTVSQIRQAKEGVVNVHEKYNHLEDSEFKRSFLTAISGSIHNNISECINHPSLVYKRDGQMDEKLLEDFKWKQEIAEYQKMLEFRKTLPAYNKKDELISVLERNQVVLVSGETGCGKTTQVPQFILDHELSLNRASLCNILCTQPRRISAVSIAERVAQERAEKLGDSVGYQIRLEQVRPRKNGSLLFCTTGILLQVMQTDPILKEYSHIVLDEIHERDTLSDFAIAILRDIIKTRKDLKIILMSATLNSEQFSKYFDNCPTIHIPGFTFPVKEYYIEDVMQLVGVFYSNNKASKKKDKSLSKWQRNSKKYQNYLDFLEPYLRNMKAQKKYSEEVLEYLMSNDAEQINLELILQLVIYICKKLPPGAILVFLPGWDKISALINKMTESRQFPDSEYVIIALHSMMPTVAQKAIFQRPLAGQRKIVVATNIAETSITIDDIVYVIDSGMIKIKNFEAENNVSTLKEEWVSLANARQRKGRAGRVQEGICYHLYSRPKELTLDSYQLPEMLRTRLEEVILQMKILQLGKAEPFLKKVMDPPSDIIVKLSIDLLKNMNALDCEEHLTPLGYHLAKLPVDPQAGKMILLAALFSCLDPITSIAASLSFKDAFVVPLGKEDRVKKVKLELSKGSKSDHILMAEVMSEWRQALSQGRGRYFTSDSFLSYSTLVLLKDMKKQFVEHLYNMRFVSEKYVDSSLTNCNSNNYALLRSIICAGLYPNIAVVKFKRNRSAIRVFTAEDNTVNIHIKSVNYQAKEIESGFLAYFLKIKSKSVQLHDTSMVFPMSLIFFCQSFTVEDFEGDMKLIKLNNEICFKCREDLAALIQELRAWLDWLLDYKIAHPGTIDWSGSSDETLILKAIVVLLTAESQLYLQEYSDCSDDDAGPSATDFSNNYSRK